MRSAKADIHPSAADKLRLVIVFYLSVPDNAISKEDINELDRALKDAGADTSAFEFVRKYVRSRAQALPTSILMLRTGRAKSAA